ncbi:MAG: 7,8-dihydropterin-6-yl-methyl-4-(beta-D-ribofuranosyl)aminobenzene 5-phosphate synthase [Acetobacteraceae bacterium]|jgi:7,8-dihydropterin-6-yl-methyl-4-(beta-D-ribofuranosyl)aminobenzene 5'-phosphate synthase|nr:7,8-dihydropterin-6-yl-methyl-4-(beta-D-ribofuranosyl)aminobenzene 5-phosphate synthase [Acetobacteraceae bacterium]
MMQRSIGRRGFIQSAAATGSFLVCYGVVDPGKAAPARIKPPVVDRLTIQAVVDTNHDIFISGTPVPGVGIERIRSPAAFNGKTLESQWGLSLHLVSSKGQDTRRYLLDFGFTPDVLANNLKLLKIDPATLDALILSHGHLDHLGGLIGFLQANRATMREELRLYVGGEDAFCHRVQQQPDGSFAPYGVLDRHNLKSLRVQPVLSELPIIIEDHAFTTGIVPRTSIETVLPNTFVVFGEKDGVGCETVKYGDHHFTAEELAGTPTPDQHWHEHATCFQVGDRGLVVITSCGHGGILNTVRRAQEITGVEKIHALCGGFHLAPAPPAYLDKIMAELKQLPIDHLIPMHCSGNNFLETAKREMPEKLVLCTTGSRFTFSA